MNTIITMHKDPTVFPYKFLKLVQPATCVTHARAYIMLTGFKG